MLTVTLSWPYLLQKVEHFGKYVGRLIIAWTLCLFFRTLFEKKGQNMDEPGLFSKVGVKNFSAGRFPDSSFWFYFV